MAPLAKVCGTISEERSLPARSASNCRDSTVRD
jgi:hypothetical protein